LSVSVLGIRSLGPPEKAVAVEEGVAEVAEEAAAPAWEVVEAAALGWVAARVWAAAWVAAVAPA
jgi:hypothetical protein